MSNFLGQGMKVVAEEPWNWFLFEDEGNLYLACSLSTAPYLSLSQRHSLPNKPGPMSATAPAVSVLLSGRCATKVSCKSGARLFYPRIGQRARLRRCTNGSGSAVDNLMTGKTRVGQDRSFADEPESAQKRTIEHRDIRFDA